MIEVKNIKKGFADKIVINDVSAKLDTGKCNLIIGASGSGKTVLMKCLVGLFEPDEGDIIYDDLNFTKMNTADRKVMRQQIGMLFQGSALFDSMTVEENVFFPLDMFSSLSYKDKRKRVQEVLDRVNLQGANKKFPSEISGGMKKRVGIARAIVLNPKYLFCDEPNSGLDPKTSVLNKNNQVWDAPNVLVTDGACMTSSACQNPSLTYMALTARAADFAVSELKKGNL